MNVSVIGPPGCGRAVFISLLYETLIRMSTPDDDGSPEAMVNAGPVEAKALGDLRLELMSGRWPSSEPGQRISELVLEIGFRKGGRSLFRSRAIRRVSLRSVPLSEKDLNAVRDSGQLREALLGSPGGSLDRYGLSERFRDSLDSEALVLLADVSKGPPDAGWPIEERDAFLATIAENASRTRLGKVRKVGLLVVLTKADRAEADDQQAFEKKYPRTATALRNAHPGGDISTRTIVSWLGTALDERGVQIPATVQRDGQVQIDYSEKEYRRLIKLIGEMPE